MHIKFLEILRCPQTAQPLRLTEAVIANGLVARGSLVTACGRRYPILRGVPRFVGGEHYASSFGYEWSRWPRVQFESENVGRPMQGHTTRMWDRITGAAEAEVRGRTIVEFGCGPGRFLDVVRRKGGVAVGMDLSRAVDAARRNFFGDGDVLIVQGDVAAPPFRQGAFDGAYSIGVLHHTPAPAEGLKALARVVRPGGWVAACVYPKGDFYDFPSVRQFRAIHRRLSRDFGYAPALAYAHVAAYGFAPAFRWLKRMGLRRLVSRVEREWLVSLYLKDARWRVLDTFDAVTPQIASTHTAAEVADWMAAAGCEGVRPTPWCPTSVCGVRAAAGACGAIAA